VLVFQAGIVAFSFKSSDYKVASIGFIQYINAIVCIIFAICLVIVLVKMLLIFVKILDLINKRRIGMPSEILTPY